MEKIKITTSCIVAGEHTPAGSQIEVETRLAKMLIGANKAVPVGVSAATPKTKKPRKTNKRTAK